MSPEEALTQIQALMSGAEWSPDTLDDIADILRQAGYDIDEPCPEYGGDTGDR